MLLISGWGVIHAEHDDASHREEMFRQVQEFKINYLSQEMELTEAQKAKFIPIYEEMSAAKRKCYEKARNMDKKLRHSSKASDEDYRQVRDAYNEAQAKWNKEEATYNQKLAEFLSYKQLYRMQEAENNFRAKLEEMRHSKNNKEHHKKK